VDGVLDSKATAILRDLDAGNCQIWCPCRDPHEALTYDVQDGDHASGIAEAHGFDDYAALWSSGNNADIKGLRADPHVLQPGDQVAIPELKAQDPVNKPTGAKHQLKIKRSPLKLRFKLLDLAAKPVSGANVVVGGVPATTDGDGLAEVDLDKSTGTVDASLPSGDVQMRPGALNPADDDTERGWKARLFNLGFLWDPTAADDDDEMAIALQDFQEEYKLDPSGQLDDATQNQLKQVYGC
jgi:hypothetical protein